MNAPMELVFTLHSPSRLHQTASEHGLRSVELVSLWLHLTPGHPWDLHARAGPIILVPTTGLVPREFQLPARDATCQCSAHSPAPFNPRAGVRFPAPFNLTREHPVSRREHLPTAARLFTAHPCACPAAGKPGTRMAQGAGTQTLTYQPWLSGKERQVPLAGGAVGDPAGRGLRGLVGLAGGSELALEERPSVREGTVGLTCTRRRAPAPARPSQLLTGHTGRARYCGHNALVESDGRGVTQEN